MLLLEPNRQHGGPCHDKKVLAAKKGKGKCNFKITGRSPQPQSSNRASAFFTRNILYVLCRETDAGFVSVPRSFCPVCRLVRWPFLGGAEDAFCSLLTWLQRLFLLWPRLLIPRCKEQQLGFVCRAGTACSLGPRSNPPLFYFFNYSKGDFLFSCSENPLHVCGSLQCVPFFFFFNIQFHKPVRLT